MVRRLVEQQDVRRRDELPREADTSTLATAQRLEPLCPRLGGIEPEALKHGIDAGRDRVAALALESFQVPPISRQGRLVMRRGEAIGLLGQ